MKLTNILNEIKINKPGSKYITIYPTAYVINTSENGFKYGNYRTNIDNNISVSYTGGPYINFYSSNNSSYLNELAYNHNDILTIKDEEDQYTWQIPFKYVKLIDIAE